MAAAHRWAGTLPGARAPQRARRIAAPGRRGVLALTDQEEPTVAELKTQPTGDEVEAFLAAVPDEGRRADARAVCDLLARVTGEPAVMWGKAIVGFGRQQLRYESGREIDWMVIGFSPRKANTTIYLPGELAAHAELFARLGKHTTGAGCLYLKRLADVDPAVLEELLNRSVAQVRPPAG
jgi:hypothetical protein